MKRWWWVFAGLALAGCSTTHVAPVVDMTGTRAAAVKRNTSPATSKVRDWRPSTHAVQKGETLYSIALEYGLDYRDLATWNGLEDINRILVGQTLRLTAPDAGTKPAESKVQAVALKPPVITTQPITESATISQPQAIKLPYSQAALIQLSRIADKPVALNPNPVQVPAPADTAVKAAGNADKPAIAVTRDAAGKEADDAALDWSWPANGPVITEFSEAKSSKGIDIGGNRGQPVYAAAAGKVVYSGSGLRGYGKLVIIKHNAMYLSAYAHNQQILVKEGQAISRGQKIAEMGDSDADRVELHFEVRQMGKPVDPLKYLPEVTK